MHSIYKLMSFPRSGRLLSKFRSAHTASKQKDESEIEILTKQDAKVSQNPAGITVASVENYSPISQVSVIIKAGSAYENSENLGVVHCLRNAATLSTINSSGFSNTRNLEVKGSKLSVASTREHIIYTLQCVRDEIDSGLQQLANVCTNNKFKHWELKDMEYRMNLDLALLETNFQGVLMEALHKAAFKGGLSNSLYSPSFMIGRHSSDMVEEFVKNNFSASRTSIVGLGVAHDDLQNSVNKLFDFGSISDPEISSKFRGGEIRIETDIPLVHTAIVAEGSGFLNTKDALSLGILQCLLGAGNNTKFGNSEFSKLGEAAYKSTNKAYSVSSLNINYSKTGLFGVYICGAPDDMKELVKSVVEKMRDISKSITDNDVQVGKHKLKAKLNLERSTSTDQISAMAIETSHLGQIRDMKDIEKAIDDLKTSDVTSIASRVIKTKPAMVSMGRLHSMPYVDEL